MADELVGLVAEHRGEAGVAQEEAALARERDADREIGEQRVVLELGVARAAGVASRRRLGTLGTVGGAAQRGGLGHFRGGSARARRARTLKSSA